MDTLNTRLVFLSLILCIKLVHSTPIIDSKLLALGPNDKQNIMITMAEGTDSILQQITTQGFVSRDERLNAIHKGLTAHAVKSQASVLKVLHNTGTTTNNDTQQEITSYWISNQIFVKRATSATINALKPLQEIRSIQAEFFVPLIIGSESGFVVETMTNGTSKSVRANTYGVNIIRAPSVWSLGYRGKGIRVANIDTGVRRTHQAFSGRFLGDYGWYDPTLHTPSPNDLQGHGTHTMGTMVGSGGIGVAPEATWMACKGCEATTCSNNALTACGQFMQCPTKGLLVQDKDCTKAPHVISNSWGGDGNDGWYASIVKAWAAGGIIPVFANGNSGPECSTAGSPGDYRNVFGIGATDSKDSLASFSSVGPAKSSGIIKPDLVAPGVGVRSSYYTSDSAYETFDGTSMATPHVAGATALLLSKNPNLTYAQIYKLLTENADRASLNGATKTCGGINNSIFPNNAFGYGRVNVFNAIQKI